MSGKKEDRSEASRNIVKVLGFRFRTFWRRTRSDNMAYRLFTKPAIRNEDSAGQLQSFKARRRILRGLVTDPEQSGDVKAGKNGSFSRHLNPLVKGRTEFSVPAIAGATAKLAHGRLTIRCTSLST